jgi:uncharacterized protein (TIRG00374 family)
MTASLSDERKSFIKNIFPKKWLALACWLVILLVAWLAVRDIPLKDILASLRSISLLQISILVLLNLVILALINGRWWIILRATGSRVPFLPMFTYRLAAFGISYFTPGSQVGGEPYRVYLLKNRCSVPGSQAAASVTLDKLFELLAGLIFLITGVIVALGNGLLAEMPVPGTILVGLGLLLASLSYVFWLWQGRAPLSSLGERLSAYQPGTRLKRRFIPFLSSTEREISKLLHQKPLEMLSVMGLSVLIPLLMLAEYWLTLTFLGQNFGLGGSLVALTAARLAFLTPLPAGVGALEASQVLAMQALGADPALGLGLSLLIRARDISFAGVGLWLAGMLLRPMNMLAKHDPLIAQPENPVPARITFLITKTEEEIV